jgi:adenine-specific DNA-methyltransferase
MKVIDLKTPYSRESFLSFFRDHFLPEDLNILDERIDPGFQSNYFKDISKIGETPSLDLAIYEIKHHSESDPRVSLSRDSFRLLSQYGQQRALILFISKKADNYRLSLVTIDLKWEEGKRVKKEYSNPRRYSFFLGPDSKTHTPEEYLLKPGRVKNFDDLRRRFSIEVVNKEFYTGIAILFTRLAGGKRAIGRQKFDEKGVLVLPSTTDDTLRKEFAVRLIGRLVFCWFLKKKRSKKEISLLPEELLSSEAVNKADLSACNAQAGKYYHNILEPLFFQVLNTPVTQRKKIYKNEPWSQIPFLNGGLFNPHLKDFYDPGAMGLSRHINTLKVPDRWLKELFELFETYNFTIDENTAMDVELSIDPEMLGRIFENLLAEINPETGETARKATGSYYTPRPVVDYMVDESLKQCLVTKTNLNEETISLLLAYEIEDVPLSDREIEEVINALDTIKVLDPACGSGAFPMGVLQKMLLILQKVDPDSKVWLNKQIAKIENPILRKEVESKLKSANVNYIHKLGIIQSAIYGVDIQPVAVDISKLRFFLSLIVDEKVNDDKENRGVDYLPNLEFKFVCANSLIGLPKGITQQEKKQETFFEASSEIDLLRNLRDEYLRSWGKEKALIEKKFRETQSRMFRHSLNWANQGGKDSQTLKLSQWDPFSFESCGWFDPEWMFGITTNSPLSKGDKGGCGGFDIVIANPPYVSALNFAEIYGSDVRNILNSTYESARGTYDIYILFMEKGIKILKQRGLLTFITPNKYLSAKYGSAFRDFINNNAKISHVVDLSAIRVFEEAAVYPIISIIENTREQKQSITVLLPRHRNIDQLNLQLYDIIKISTSLLGLLPEKIWGFLLSRNVKLLPKIISDSKPLEWYGNINATSTAAEADEYGSFISKNNSKGSVKIVNTGTIDKYASLWGNCKFTHSGKKFLKPYLPLNDTIINDRRRQMYMSPKIIFAKMAKECEALLDLDGEYASINTNCFYGPNSETELEFVGAFCNSKLFMFIYELFFGALRMSGGYYQFQSPQLRVIPLKKISKPKQQPFVELVRKIVMTKKRDPGANTSAMEKQIDQMVYKLYGLTPEEIKIVENRK